MKPLLALVLAGVALPLASPALRADDSMALEEAFYGEIPQVTVVSKSEEPAELAPAVVTVLTAEEMQRRGVRTISEALQRVAGFFPSRQVFHDDLLGVRVYF